MKNVLNNVALRFSRAAFTYEGLAEVQKKVALDLMRIIPGSLQVDKLLEIGCGTGIVTRFLKDRFPETDMHVVDVSSKMMEEHQKNIGSDKIRRYVSDICTLRTGVCFPLLISNCVLHWIRPLEDAFKQLYGLTTEGGLVIASFMIRGTLWELRESRQRVAPHKMPKAQLPEPQDILSAVTQADFSIISSHPSSYEIYYPSSAHLLKALNATGVTGGDYSRAYAPLSRTELKNLMSDYEKYFQSRGQGIHATYQVLFVIAKKG